MVTMNRTANKRDGELRTGRVTVRRRPQRGFYDHETAAAILDATFLCHVGIVADGQPYVIPTSFGRDGKRLYIHGSAASRTLRHLSRPVPICVTVTLLDGLVLARSAFNHSMNYRSVVILGEASLVEGEEKLRALEIMSEHIIPGRWADVRKPTEAEMRATSVLKVDIAEASAKIRNGPPLDDEEDLGWPCWAGELPFTVERQPPIPDPKLPAGVAAPDYVSAADRHQRPDSAR
jgi:nitroimidazol reductase NimA-like FMN-containing flavoprotein (pyridoxamine 5'-phosphate oxidase superfamily)